MVTEESDWINGMNKITLDYKQISAIVLIIINILIIGPGSWVLNAIWHDAVMFKSNTQEQFKAIRQEIAKSKIYVSKNYLTRQSFNNYREQMAKNIRYLDNKISKD